MNPSEIKRKKMVEYQIRSRGITSSSVLAALEKVERDHFVTSDKRELAYEDTPLPIGHGQTISQPYIVALMTELACLTGSEKVLEVGTGSGYQCAVLSLLSARVFSLERIRQLADRARQKLENSGFTNCSVLCRDGYQGLPEEAPFDAIIVTAAPPEIPQNLLQQLTVDGGRIILPVGSYFQKLLRITRNGNTFGKEDILDVVFVPMLPGMPPDA